ncbi:MAG: transglutaminase domain-containing protein, partial [Clostridium sp.]
GNEYQKQLMAIEPTVTRILSTIKPDMDEYQVIGQIENEFDGSLIYYDNGKYTTSETIVGALENHSAVCGGFAEGLSYLLERVGIENIWISGYTSKGGILHAWNNVDVYGKWYIADPTWQQSYRNPALWYLVGTQDQQDIGAHIEQNTYGGMPMLQKHGINYGTVMSGQKYVNLMGDTNYKINNNGTITITYNDKTKEDKNVQLNLNTDGWKAESMKNEGNGIWTATVPYKKGENLDFYFTINNLYGTAGNIKTNSLQTTVITDGINAVTVI